MIAELGRRLGELELLGRQHRESESRVNSALSDFDAKLHAAVDELLGKHEALRSAFIEHKHDMPALEIEQAPADLAHVIDHPVETVDDAIGDVVGTPEAPKGEAQVQAPKALKASKVYQSRIHRGK